ncbi:MAG: NAD(P)/FAD-dependent oxidoreductase [Tissierellales bacterium]|nr:NAD(P)/FAD-dependent oxidoreductase [Tissierellales bacterium]
MKDKKHIVLLGAGYGGILTAKKLAKKLKKNEEYAITLIDKRAYHTMLTELHEVAAGRVPEDAIRIELNKIFAGRKVDVVLDNIDSIDFDKRVLKGDAKDYSYDYLVLGTGSKPAFFGCKGAEENCLTLWSYEDALRIKHHILETFRKASETHDQEERSKLLTFVTVGCGFTGVEMAGELGEWAKKLCKDFYIDPSEVTMYIMDMLPKVLPMLDDRLIEKTENRLKKLGVEILLKSNITEVKADGVIINGSTFIPSETIIWAAGVEGSEITTDLKLQMNNRGRVETDAFLRAKGREEVFVVGDNIFFIPEGAERPVPQMVENAEHSASTVAKNLVAAIEGNEMKAYKPEFHGMMVCIGGGYGVAQVQTSNTGKPIKFSGFLAMFIKHFINVIYFLQVAGFHKIWVYMMHEFFHVPDRRSFLGGHFSKRSPNFWLVPLRLFLGFKWLEQGLHKLPGVIADPGHIFLIPAKVMAVSGASVAETTKAVADAVTSATQAGGGEAAQGAAEAASAWGSALPVPEFIHNIVDWSMNLIFYTPDGGFTVMASVFQTAMVLGEVIVGLCLLAGLFTAVASIGSIAMGAMIWASGMAPPEMLWYIAGGFATIGGSGSTFGLDYYVYPFLKKYWKKIKFVKKWYMYTD